MDKETYTVCHDCQTIGLRHCAHPEECEGTKEYPRTLRDMIETDYHTNVPLSITAEKAFDMGREQIYLKMEEYEKQIRNFQRSYFWDSK